MQNNKFTDIQYELVNSTKRDYKEVRIVFNYKNKIKTYSLFYPKTFTKQKCLNLAKKDIDKMIDNGTLEKQYQSFIIRHKKKFIIGLAAVIVATGITLGAVYGIKAANNYDVTLTLNSGIGSFDNDVIVKEFRVKKGTKLNELSSDNPTFQFYDPEETTTPTLLTCYLSHWSKEDSDEQIPLNCEINKDTKLVAHYFENTIDLKGWCLGYIADRFNRAYVQESTEDFLNYYNKETRKILSFENESQIVGYSNAFYYSIGAYVLVKDKIAEYFNVFSNKIIAYQDQRAITLGNISKTFIELNYIFSLDFVKNYCDFVSTDIAKMNFETSYYYSDMNLTFLNMYLDTKEDVREVLINALKYFSAVYANVQDMNKVKQIAPIINEYFETVKETADITVAKAEYMFEVAKELVEGII